MNEKIGRWFGGLPTEIHDQAAFRLEGVGFEKEMAEMERRYLHAALERIHGVRTQAADLLKISYRSFRHYAKKHNL